MSKQILSPSISRTAAAVVFVLVAALTPIKVFAEEGIDEIENMLSKEESAVSPADEALPSGKQAGEIKDVSDLANLSPMSDIAVIQKRYLPKTGRFEVFGALSSILNDVFFLNFGANFRIGYYIRERYGIELSSMFLTTAERQVTTDLGNKDVQTKSFVTPKSYIGADFKWVPIYGKMAWRNRKITPFDLYFSIGGGTTSTNQGTSEPTFHLGTGQIFALSKSTAFRWDFSWHAFQSKAGSGTTQSSSNFNNLFITVGMSFFFPEATYR